MHFKWVLVGIVFKIDEPIIQQESRVTLLPIRVIYLVSTLNILKGLDDKATSLVIELPSRLTWSSVIQHIGVRYKAISFMAIHADAENTTRHHHPHLTILLEGELTIVWHLIDDHVVVCLDVFNLLADLILERTSLEPCSLFLCVEDWEVIECLGQDVDVFVVEGGLLPSLLHDVGRKERMLR